MVGLLLPFLTVPNIVKGHNIVLGVDNTSVIFSWENKSANGDLTASVLIRALHLVASYLECRIFTKHVPRQSCKASVTADALTRASTARPEVWHSVQDAEHHSAPRALWDWLRTPDINWQLGFTLIEHLKMSM